MVVDKGSVETKHCGIVTSIDDPLQWPSGREILDWLASQGFYYPDEHGIDNNNNNNHQATDDTSSSSKNNNNDSVVSPEEYWQASARWALLNKYGLLTTSLKGRYKIVEGWKRLLELSQHDVHSIQEIWKTRVVEVTSTTTETSSSSSSPPSNEQLTDNQNTTTVNELIEWIATSRSNGKQLKWSFLLCGPACQFKLHAHANIEMVYCVQGALHEIRMDGSPIGIECSEELDGVCPSLLSLQRKWSFATLHEGEWLVNEVGSVHKSFTATSGEGCVLLVLWSGFHWNVRKGEEPNSVNVAEAVEQMDDRLGACHGDCSKWDTVQEIFLPDSEKGQSQSK